MGRRVKVFALRFVTFGIALLLASCDKAEPTIIGFVGGLTGRTADLGVSDNILLKPGSLSGDEMALMKEHPQIAFQLLTPIDFLRDAVDIPHCHHEKWDGSGYPRGLKGEEIPLAARIFAIVDVFDALCSDRPYRPAWPAEKARDHIRSQSGIHFDPAIVEIFLAMEWQREDFTP